MNNPTAPENQTDREHDQNIWIVIPAFNEEKCIGEVLDRFSHTTYSVVVVDDCSSDSTVNVASGYSVVLLKHLINLGQGAALQTGFDYLLQKTDAKFVVTFDSDGQHDIEDIPKIVKLLDSGQYDVVLGSRFLQTNKVEGMPFIKYVVLKLGLLFTRATTGLMITDTHNGLRGFSIDALRMIHINQNRMAHASEILSQVAKRRLRFREVQVNIRYTDYSMGKGQSIFNFVNILWDLFWGRN